MEKLKNLPSARYLAISRKEGKFWRLLNFNEQPLVFVTESKAKKNLANYKRILPKSNLDLIEVSIIPVKYPAETKVVKKSKK